MFDVDGFSESAGTVVRAFVCLTVRSPRSASDDGLGSPGRTPGRLRDAAHLSRLPVLLPLLLACTVAALVGVLATRAARDLAIRLGHLDEPDERKVHAEAVPRVGGIGIALGLGAGVVALTVFSALFGERVPFGPVLPIMFGATAVFALGLVDDIVGLGFKWRFAVQAGVAWAMTLFGWRIDLANVPFVMELGAYEQAAIAVPLTVIWTVGIINAMNLLDGLDALAGGTALIGFAALATAFFPGGDPVLTTLCALAAASTLGFLAYNRPPASVFMGDGGSTLLGFLLAMAGVRGVDSMPSGGLIILPVVALGLPVLDTLTQMVRRLGEGRSPFLPDRDHLHHRAYDRSPTVQVAVAKLHATAAVFGVLAVALRFATGEPWLQVAILIVTVLFAFAVVRRLGYVRVRDVARSVRLRFWKRARTRRRAKRAKAAGPVPPAPIPLPTDLGPPSGDGAYGGDGAGTRGVPEVREPR